MRHIPHYFGVARQVIWTACGKHIVTRTRRAVHVWSLSPNLDRKTEFRYETSAFILGIPKTKENISSKFISIEGIIMNKLVIIDAHGDEERKAYDFEESSIQHVDVTSDGSHLLIAAEVFESPDGLIPITASPARKLIVFNLHKFRVEHEVPLRHDVQHVTISQNGRMAIVTYRDGLPPQLWSLRKTLAGMRLSFEHQFSPKKTEGINAKNIIFSGKGHFLSKDRFVLCTTTAGEIYIWRRDRTEPFHVIDQLSNDNDKPLEVACNPTSDHFMFATRSQDGSVRIWKTREAVLNELPAGDPPQTLSADNMLGLHPTSESPVFEPTSLPPRATGSETVMAQGPL